MGGSTTFPEEAPVSNAHLLDIRDATTYDPSDPRDLSLFADLAATLVRHGASQRFGICLLHKHFDVADGEMLVESTDAARRELVTSVVRANEVSSRAGALVQTSWSFASGRSDSMTPEVSCEVYCWEDKNGNHRMSHKKE